jgi:aminoglycoside 6'-N-acetyltransferase I
MNLEVRLTSKDESYIIKNMYPLYLHDLSEQYGKYPNKHGIFEDDDAFATLMEQYEVQNIWWEKPDCLFPYLFFVDERPAGFGLIATPPHCSKGIDFFVNDFFLLRPYRGKNIAEQAAKYIFDQYKGNWELFTNPSESKNVGQAFWRKTIAEYTQGNYDEQVGHTFDGYKRIFRFSNAHSD